MSMFTQMFTQYQLMRCESVEKNFVIRDANILRSKCTLKNAEFKTIFHPLFESVGENPPYRQFEPGRSSGWVLPKIYIFYVRNMSL